MITAFMTIKYSDITKGASSEEALGNTLYVKNHEDEIHVLECMDGAHTQTDMKTNNLHLMHKPLVITKHLDKTSPLLMNELSQGMNLGKVTIDFYRNTMTSGQELYYRITMHDTILIRGELFSDENGDAKEKISFAYKDIEKGHLASSTFATTKVFVPIKNPKDTTKIDNPTLNNVDFIWKEYKLKVTHAGLYAPIVLKIDTSHIEQGAEGIIELYDDNWGMPKTHITKEPIKFTVGGGNPENTSTEMPLALFKDPNPVIKFIRDDIDQEPIRAMTLGVDGYKDMTKPLERAEGKQIELYAKVTIAGQTKTSDKLIVDRKLSRALMHAPKDEKLVIRAIRKLSALSDFKEGNIAGIENSALLHEHLFFVDDKTDIGLLGQDAGVGHDKAENLDKYVVKAVYKDEENIYKDIAHRVAVKKHEEFIGVSETRERADKASKKEFFEGIKADYGMVGGYNCQAYVEEVIDTADAFMKNFNAKKEEKPWIRGQGYFSEIMEELENKPL